MKYLLDNSNTSVMTRIRNKSIEVHFEVKETVAKINGRGTVVAEVVNLWLDEDTLVSYPALESVYMDTEFEQKHRSKLKHKIEASFN